MKEPLGCLFSHLLLGFEPCPSAGVSHCTQEEMAEGRSSQEPFPAPSTALPAVSCWQLAQALPTYG